MGSKKITKWVILGCLVTVSIVAVGIHYYGFSAHKRMSRSKRDLNISDAVLDAVKRVGRKFTPNNSTNVEKESDYGLNEGVNSTISHDVSEANKHPVIDITDLDSNVEENNEEPLVYELNINPHHDRMVRSAPIEIKSSDQNLGASYLENSKLYTIDEEADDEGVGLSNIAQVDELSQDGNVDVSITRTEILEGVAGLVEQINNAASLNDIKRPKVGRRGLDADLQLDINSPVLTEFSLNHSEPSLGFENIEQGGKRDEDCEMFSAPKIYLQEKEMFDMDFDGLQIGENEVNKNIVADVVGVFGVSEPEDGFEVLEYQYNLSM